MTLRSSKPSLVRVPEEEASLVAGLEASLDPIAGWKGLTAVLRAVPKSRSAKGKLETLD